MKLASDKIDKLKEPLPPEAIHPHPTKPYLSTIKAIYVVERFNEVFGLGGWYIKNEFVEKTKRVDKKTGEERENEMVVVKSNFTAPDFGIEVEMYGGNDNEDLGDAYKGACTDALTKIGSYLYVGIDVYKGLATVVSDKRKNPPTKEDKLFKSATGRIDAALFVADCDLIIERARAYEKEEKLSKTDADLIVKKATEKRTQLERAQDGR